jgi:hypothetical protein
MTNALQLRLKTVNLAIMGASDRRQRERFDTALPVAIRFQADGTPIQGSCIEISPNGMRLITATPLVEASYVHIAFEGASNNTHCEGRVVWTQRNQKKDSFESGVDVQRWGGSVPGDNAIRKIPDLTPKPDRRRKPR